MQFKPTHIRHVTIFIANAHLWQVVVNGEKHGKIFEIKSMQQTSCTNVLDLGTEATVAVIGEL